MDKLKVSIGNSQTLEYLDITGFNPSNLHLALEGLVKNKTLHTLILNQCRLKKQVLPSIASHLKYNTKLKTLALQGNDFAGKDLDSLSESIVLNKTLKELDLSDITVSEAFI